MSPSDVIKILEESKALNIHIEAGCIYSKHPALGTGSRKVRLDVNTLAAAYKDAWGRMVPDNTPTPEDVLSYMQDAVISSHNHQAQTPEECFVKLITQLNISYDCNAWYQTTDGRKSLISAAVVEAKIALALSRHNLAHQDDKKNQFTMDLMKHAKLAFTDDYDKRYLRQLQDKISYDPAHTHKGCKTLEEVITKVLTAYGCDLNKPYVQILCQYIWETKRNIFELAVPRKYLYIIYGRQGCGKTEFFRTWCPDERYHQAGISLTTLEDDGKYRAAVRRKRTIDLEELAGDLDIETFKKRITAKTTLAQDKYANDATEEFVYCTLTASTNLHIYDKFHDKEYTRFLEIEFPYDKNKTPWMDLIPLIGSIPDKTEIQSIYRLCDENDDTGYIHVSKPDVWEAISQLQASYCGTPSILNFLLSESLKLSETEGAGYVRKRCRDLFDSFNDFLMAQGDAQLKSARVFRELIATHCDIRPVEINGSYYYYVKDCKNTIDIPSYCTTDEDFLKLISESKEN